MRRYLLVCALGAALLMAGGCAQHSIIVSKGAPEVKGGYKGLCVLGDLEHTNSVLDALCSGDLEQILDHTSLTFVQRDEFIEASCGQEASPKKVYELYTQLPDEQKGELVRAFELLGYHLHGYG